MEPWKLSLTAGVAGAILSIVVGLIFADPKVDRGENA